MKYLNVSEAKTRFSSVVESVEGGETVVICRRNTPIARISAVPKSPERVEKHCTKIGWAKGTNIRIRADLTEPVLPEGDWSMME